MQETPRWLAVLFLGIALVGLIGLILYLLTLVLYIF